MKIKIKLVIASLVKSLYPNILYSCAYYSSYVNLKYQCITFKHFTLITITIFLKYRYWESLAII